MCIGRLCELFIGYICLETDKTIYLKDETKQDEMKLDKTRRG